MSKTLRVIKVVKKLQIHHIESLQTSRQLCWPRASSKKRRSNNSRRSMTIFQRRNRWYLNRVLPACPLGVKPLPDSWLLEPGWKKARMKYMWHRLISQRMQLPAGSNLIFSPSKSSCGNSSNSCASSSKPGTNSSFKSTKTVAMALTPATGHLAPKLLSTASNWLKKRCTQSYSFRMWTARMVRIDHW